MNDKPTLETLRAASEDDVLAALDGATVDLPLSDPVDLLEFYNRMLDVLGVPDADGDVFEPDI